LALLLRDCPVWLDTLMAQLLEKDPRKRPESAAEVRVAIEETHHKLSTGASVAEHVLGRSPSAIRSKKADDEVRQLLPARKNARASAVVAGRKDVPPSQAIRRIWRPRYGPGRV